MYLKDLLALDAVSGNENNVRNYIIEKITDKVDKIEVDSIGNIIAYKKGLSSKKKIMISAHMDEVGFMISGINDNGTLRFKAVGGIDQRILPGKRVNIYNNNIKGVLGVKPIHLQTLEERSIQIKMKNMYIDIGLTRKEDAEKKVKLGDFVAFDNSIIEFGDNLIKSKALDDRVGCSILMQMLDLSIQDDLYIVFTVQEEVGLRGSTIASYLTNPDISIVIEGTTCSDLPETKEHEISSRLGNGVAISFMDRTTIYNKKLFEFIKKVAKEESIKFQYKNTTTGGNDSGKIQFSNSGVITGCINVPVRYLHSPVSVMSYDDYNDAKNLMKALLLNIQNIDTTSL